MRRTLKVLLAIVVIGGTVLGFMSEGNAAVKHRSAAKRTVIIFYSQTNNTTRLAHKIHKESGVDVIRIKPQKAYPSDGDAINARVRREHKSNQYDQLLNVPSSLKKYDRVLVGFPIWSNDVAYPIQSFLSQNQSKLAGKRIEPFSTSASADSSAIKQSVRTIKRLVPDAHVEKGLNLTSGDTNTKKVKDWVKTAVFKR